MAVSVYFCVWVVRLRFQAVLVKTLQLYKKSMPKCYFAIACLPPHPTPTPHPQITKEIKTWNLKYTLKLWGSTNLIQIIQNILQFVVFPSQWMPLYFMIVWSYLYWQEDSTVFVCFLVSRKHISTFWLGFFSPLGHVHT